MNDVKRVNGKGGVKAFSLACQNGLPFLRLQSHLRIIGQWVGIVSIFSHSRGLHLKIYRETELAAYIPDSSAHEPDIPVCYFTTHSQETFPPPSAPGTSLDAECSVIITCLICSGSQDRHKPNCISCCERAKITSEYIKGSLTLEFSSIACFLLLCSFLRDVNMRNLYLIQVHNTLIRK